MKIRDLGVVEGPALLFGGPCSNLQALRALIALGFPAGRTICTGDVAAYCADPAATVAEIRAFGCAVVAGNCEERLGAGAEDCGCGFAEGTVCDALAARWYAHADARVGAEDRAWMRGLPARAVFRHRGRRFAVIHGAAEATERFIWPDVTESELLREINILERDIDPVDGVVCGHSGIGFIREVAGKLWINAGAIGMPPNDGRTETEYVVLDGAPRLHRLAYDHESAARAMEAAGLTDGYHAALRTGFWPSEEALPPSLRRGALAKSAPVGHKLAS